MTSVNMIHTPSQVLGLPEDGVVRDAPMRDNLRLKVGVERCGMAELG